MTVYELWLPIAFSGVACHVLSTMFWMVLPHHKPEWKKLPNEDTFTDWIKQQKIPADQYVFPMTHDSREMNSPEFRAKQARCSGMLILWKDSPHMLKAIVLTLTFFLVASFVIGYLASIAVPRGAEFMTVFQFVFTAGLLAHCFAKFPHVLWFRRRIMMELLDGVAYAAATAAIFGALWPAVVA